MKISILLIEDDRDMRDLVARHLEHSGEIKILNLVNSFLKNENLHLIQFSNLNNGNLN